MNSKTYIQFWSAQTFFSQNLFSPLRFVKMKSVDNNIQIELKSLFN